jgi:hypothetical protein
LITVACVYYEGINVPYFSKCYTPEWVDKLYRGVLRNYKKDFRFVCLTDKEYKFEERIEQQPLWTTNWPTACQQLYGIEAERLLLLGLDTIITGNLHAIFHYNGVLAVPRDPYRTESPCNAVVLCPSRIDIAHSPAESDMRVLDRYPKDWLDDLFPGQIKSYKVHVLKEGLGDARIVYFHGEPKPHVLDDPWVKEHWR